MQKVYRLLRNNKELGPMGLDELLQARLGPLDLVWVEGKSCAWAYPYEITELKTHVPAPPPPAAPKTQAAGKQVPIPEHVFVSLPAASKQKEAIPSPDTDIEHRAEALRLRMQQVQHTPDATDDLPQTNYNRSLYEAEDAYTKWLYEKKTRRRRMMPKYLLTAALVGAIFSGGLFAGKFLQPAKIVMPEMQVQQRPAALPAVSRVQETTDDTAMAPIPVDSADSLLTTADIITAALPKSKVLDSNKQAPGSIGAADSMPQAAVEAPAVAAVPPTRVQEEAVKESPAETTKPAKAGFLSGLFRKKNRETTVATLPSPSAQAGTPDRKSRKRDEVPAESRAADVANQVELRPTTTANNWMLGITGQKLTLVSRGAIALQSATVEVHYFGEDNNLLERRTLSFANVAPKGKTTVAVPDHRTAERVSFKLVTANGATGADN